MMQQSNYNDYEQICSCRYSCQLAYCHNSEEQNVNEKKSPYGTSYVTAYQMAMPNCSFIPQHSLSR
jgi:hypothetical protein